MIFMFHGFVKIFINIILFYKSFFHMLELKLVHENRRLGSS